jgi:sugar lactone lactonase YvrE
LIGSDNMRNTRLFYKYFVVGLLVLVACRSGHRVTVERTPPPASLAIVAAGAPIHGANGLAFSESGDLYVASWLGDEILALDPDAGELISTVGANQGIVGPEDVAIGTDGSLYWTSISVGEVARLRPDGTTERQLLMPGVNGITFSDDGRLFVSITFMGDAIYELDPGLAAPPRLVAANPGFLNSLDWGPDGLLYSSLLSRGEIVRVDVGTGEMETVAEGFEIPAAVKFDPEGRLFALDHATGEVFRIDIGTGGRDLLATLTPGVDNLAFDPTGRLFVSHAQDGCICEILNDGSKRYVWTGGMIAPGGVVALANADGEAVFVADLWCLREFDGKTGEPLKIHRHMPQTHMGITTPCTVTADGDKLILTSYIVEDAVQVYDPSAQEVLLDIRNLKSPLSAVRFQQDLVVAEQGTNSVIRISRDDPDERTVLAAGLGVPTGLAATDNDLWVCDLALDRDGTLLVREGQTGCLKRVDPATGEVSLVVSSITPCLQGEHPTWIFNGVAVGPSGTIYITCDATNSLYRLEPSP